MYPNEIPYAFGSNLNVDTGSCGVVMSIHKTNVRPVTPKGRHVDDNDLSPERFRVICTAI
jgi:hypothetical protein